MIIRQITTYMQGKLSENEVMALWKQLIVDEEAFEILEMYLMLSAYFAGKES